MPQVLPFLDAAAAALLKAEISYQSTQQRDALPQGVIHADLFPDNVFFLNDKLSGLIDYYFACNEILAYDLGICLNAWCFEPDISFNATKARRLVRAYDKVRKLTPAEIAPLSVVGMTPVGQYAYKIAFSDGHDSGLYAWDYLYALGVRQDALWEEYLRRLAAAGASR